MADTCGSIRVITGGILIHLTLGTIYTFGNLSPYLTSYIRKHSDYSDLSYADSVWIFALAGMGQGTTMYFGGLMEKRLGTRKSTLLGCWFQSLGIALTYFTVKHSFAATVFTYGLMFGFGIGVAYAVPLAVGMRWLPHRKGLVNGCVVAGFGGGAFIFNLVQTAYINPDNKSPDVISADGEKYFNQPDVLERVPTIFLILGGTYAVMQLIGCLLLSNPPGYQVQYTQLPSSVKEEEEEIPAPDGPESSDKNGRSSPIPLTESDTHLLVRNTHQEDEALTPREVLRKPCFYQLWFIFLLNGQGTMFISSLYKAYGQGFIFDDVFLAWVGTFAALCNASGRIMWGTLADRFSFKISMLLLSASFTILMLTLGVTSLAGRWLFLVWVGLLFLVFSGSYSLMPTATARSFGQAHVAKNYGLVFTSQTITSVVSAILASTLKSAIGWYGMFYMISAFSFISFILTVTFKRKMPDGRDV